MSGDEDEAEVVDLGARRDQGTGYMTCRECGGAWFKATVTFGTETEGGRKVTGYGIADGAGVPQVTCNDCGAGVPREQLGHE